MPGRAEARAFVLFIAVLLLFGCTDSTGCDGMEPIPGGFPLDRRVENGFQMRLTPSGIDFVEENIGEILAAAVGGSLLFELPPTSVTGAEVCPDERTLTG